MPDATWLESNEKTTDLPAYTRRLPNGHIVCTCSAYDFPHRHGGGKCSECERCGQPSFDCVCYDPYHRLDL